MGTCAHIYLYVGPYIHTCVETSWAEEAGGARLDTWRRLEEVLAGYEWIAGSPPSSVALRRCFMGAAGDQPSISERANVTTAMPFLIFCGNEIEKPKAGALVLASSNTTTADVAVVPGRLGSQTARNGSAINGDSGVFLPLLEVQLREGYLACPYCCCPSAPRAPPSLKLLRFLGDGAAAAQGAGQCVAGWEENNTPAGHHH